jgi:hypothetical protein
MESVCVTCARAIRLTFGSSRDTWRFVTDMIVTDARLVSARSRQSAILSRLNCLNHVLSNPLLGAILDREVDNLLSVIRVLQ